MTKEEEIEKLHQKIAMMRHELAQYINDLTMWQKAHGNDYPIRRIDEIRTKMQEIENL